MVHRPEDGLEIQSEHIFLCDASLTPLIYISFNKHVWENNATAMSLYAHMFDHAQVCLHSANTAF